VNPNCLQLCAGLEYPSSIGPLHGDGHVENLMRAADGSVVIIDLEGFALGHPEWDLIVTGTEYLSAGWVTDRQYADFVDAYGFDITKWSGYGVMRDVQEFSMTTWLMQNIGRGSRDRRGVFERLDSIRNDTSVEAGGPSSLRCPNPQGQPRCSG